MIELSDANLEAMRRRGDRDASSDTGPDAAIAEVAALSPDLAVERAAGAVRNLWQRSLTGGLTPDGDEAWLKPYPILRDQLNRPRSQLLPPWVDHQRVYNGQLFFGKWGPQIVLGLLFGSLPASYACGKGARAVYFTGRLETDTRRRVFETAGFLLDVMQPGGLDPDWPRLNEPGLHGIDSCRQVRLMHAMLRRLIRKTGTDDGLKETRRFRPDRVPTEEFRWNEAEWGLPINQEDLAGTLADFALLPLLLIDGDALDPAEREDYIHAWRVVGWLMGIEEDLLPDTYLEMEWLGRRVLRHQMEPSAAGRALTEALIQMMEQEIPGRRFDAGARHGVVSALRRIDAGLVHTLGLSSTTQGRWTLKLARFLLELFCVQESIRLGNRTFGAGWGYDVLNALVAWDRGYRRTSFSIPGSLAESWEMGDPQRNRFWRRSWTQQHSDPGPEERETRLWNALALPIDGPAAMAKSE